MNCSDRGCEACRPKPTKISRRFGSRLHRVKLPGCKHFEFDFDGLLTHSARFHDLSVVDINMGLSSDPTAAVESKRRNQRIIDIIRRSFAVEMQMSLVIMIRLTDSVR